MTGHNDLGPLPQADRNSVLQQESVRALLAALSPEHFVFRPEGIIDAGVDGSLELLIDSQYTNLRAQIQLKSTDSAEARQDGAVTYRVKVSNLNYLLNGPSPFYILYVVPLKELWFTSARDERNRIERENSQWMEQATVTLSFRDRIEGRTLAEIHDRIRSEAILDRRSRDGLSRIGLTEKAKFRIDSGSPEVTEPDEIRELLLSHGYHLVTNGQTSRVLELIDRLQGVDRKVPKVALVAAYAERQRGRYDLALGHITNAALNFGGLTEDDRLFMDALRDDCDLRIGRITAAEFIDRQQALAEMGTGEFHLARRLDSLRHSLREEGRPDRQEEIAKQIIAVAKEALVIEDSSDSFKVQVQICLVDAEGYTVIRRYGRCVGLARTRRSMRMPTDPDGMIDEFNDHLRRWVKMANETADDAGLTGIAQLVGDAIIARTNILFVHCASVQLNSKIDSSMDELDISPVEKYFVPDLEQAIRIFQHTGNIDSELQAKILLANFFDLIGRSGESASLAAEVLPIAKALRLVKIVRDAEGHISGLPFHRRKEAEFDAVINQDADVMMANHDDEDIKVFARTALDAMSLPLDRLPNVLKESLSIRDVARERLDWCRHIDLIQETEHTLLRVTLHSIDPNRYCVCLKYELRSAIGSPDWIPIIGRFKQACCAKCPDRSPKVRNPTKTKPVTDCGC